ncbi:hypothetical protein NL676_009390 [Syzygium grande]|nr:hypothetical protein NL676_009390 [Syzygium grande]
MEMDPGDLNIMVLSQLRHRSWVTIITHFFPGFGIDFRSSETKLKWPATRGTCDRVWPAPSRIRLSRMSALLPNKSFGFIEIAYLTCF